MKTLLLAVLLTIGQTCAPVPRKAANHSGSTSQDVNHNANANNKPAAATTIKDAPASPADEHSGQGKASPDTKNPITVSELPPVSITRDWIDYTAWGLSVAIVVIGAVGVCFARRTLIAMEGQLAEIHAASKQTTKMIEHAGNQASAALLNAQVLRNSERPWVLIESQRGPGSESSSLTARNSGRSPARLVMTSEPNWKFIRAIDLIDLPPERPNCGTISPIQDSIILLPGEGTYILNITDWDLRRKCESEDRFKAIKDGNIELYIFGKLIYQDLLRADSDSFHETGWCCHYISPNLAGPGNFLSMFGLPGYSYHT